MTEELKKMEQVKLEVKEEVKVKEEAKAKSTTDYFKITEVAMDITKDANPSVLDHLGIYRGPVFTALVAYFGLHMVGWDFIAEVVGMGLIVICVVHKLLHMGTIKESLNDSIDSVVEGTKQKLKKRKEEKRAGAQPQEAKKE